MLVLSKTFESIEQNFQRRNKLKNSISNVLNWKNCIESQNNTIILVKSVPRKYQSNIDAIECINKLIIYCIYIVLNLIYKFN